MNVWMADSCLLLVIVDYPLAVKNVLLNRSHPSRFKLSATLSRRQQLFDCHDLCCIRTRGTPPERQFVCLVLDYLDGHGRRDGLIVLGKLLVIPAQGQRSSE